jgi:hypothetical protein
MGSYDCAPKEILEIENNNFDGSKFLRYRLPGFRDKKVAHLPIQKSTSRDKPILICSPAFRNPTGNACVQHYTPNDLGGYVEGSKNALMARMTQNNNCGAPKIK